MHFLETKQFLMTKRRGRHAMLISFFVMFFLLIVSPYPARAIGISPGKIEIKDVRVNTQREVDVIFSRGNPSSDEKVEVTLSGEVIQILDNPAVETVVLPQGVKTYAHLLRINTQDSELQEYEGVIDVKVLSEKDGSPLITQEGARSDIAISVTRNTKQSVSIESASIADSGDAYSLKFSVANEGNVDENIERIEVSILDESGEILQTDDAFESGVVPINDTKAYLYKIPVLEKGSYILEVRGKTQSGILFNKKVSYTSSPQDNTSMYIALFSGILILCIIYLIFKLRNTHHARKKD
jgi:hypothetical protein